MATILDFTSAHFADEWARHGITMDEKPDYQTEPYRYAMWDAMNDGYWPTDYIAEYITT